VVELTTVEDATHHKEFKVVRLNGSRATYRLTRFVVIIE
jgi:hypothetical protein